MNSGDKLVWVFSGYDSMTTDMRQIVLLMLSFMNFCGLNNVTL